MEIKPDWSSISIRYCPTCHAQNPATVVQVCHNCGRLLDDSIPPLGGNPVSMQPSNSGINPRASALMSLPLLQPGNKLDEFKIIKPLNSTPNIVNLYLAEIDLSGKQALVKETGAGWVTAQQFIQAYEILSSVSDPAIPVSLKCFQKENRHYLCLEWKEGSALNNVWGQNNGNELQQFRWIKEICRAIFLLNQQSGLCLEIRPSSVIVTQSGNLFIRDLAMLRRLPVAQTDILPYSFYTAPEVYARREDVSHRSDVYAIGATWLALLLGESLQQKHTDNRILLAPSELLPVENFSPAANRIIARCLHRSLEKRYKSVYLLDRALDQAILDSFENEKLLKLYRNSPNLAAFSDMGKERDNNEDSFYADSYSGTNGDYVIALVADGMGGEEGGEVASGIAREFLKTALPPVVEMALIQNKAGNASSENFYNRKTDLPGVSEGQSQFANPSWQNLANSLLSQFKDLISEASKRVNEKGQSEPKLRNMGCTLVTAVILENQVFIANVGDSRAYLIRNNLPIQISQDHTRLSDLRKQGHAIDSREASRMQGVISRNIGYNAVAEPFTNHHSLKSGDYLLLCCDGLTDSLSDEQIVDLISQGKRDTLINGCFRLINAAIIASGHDNTTVVLYRHP